MKEYGRETELLMDWFISFYERVLPKKPPKIPTKLAVARAAMISYDSDPAGVPARFVNGFTIGFTPGERRKIAIHRITKWALEYISAMEQYMAKEYSVLVVFQDGDPTSQGKRIVPNRDTEENRLAAMAQAEWDHAHCKGTHEREDSNAEQINRLQPKAAVSRHKLVNLPLPKPKGGKK